MPERFSLVEKWHHCADFVRDFTCYMVLATKILNKSGEDFIHTKAMI